MQTNFRSVRGLCTRLWKDSSKSSRRATERELRLGLNALLRRKEGSVSSFRSSQEPARPAPRATVLVVEDETTLRQAVVKMLQKADFEILEAATGSPVIDLLSTERKQG